MLDNSYHQFLEENSKDLLDVGEYSYSKRTVLSDLLDRTPFFSCDSVKKSRAKLPMDMCSRGLLILGCYRSYRHRLANYYARSLVNRGVNVLYITDNMAAGQHRPEYEKNTAIKHLGIRGDDDSVRLSKLTEKFDPTVFDNGVMLSVVCSDEARKSKDATSRDRYDETLASYLKQVKQHMQSVDEKKSGVEFVVILDEDAPEDGIHNDQVVENLIALMRVCRGRRDEAFSKGLVICGSETARYAKMKNQIEHYISFRARGDNPLDVFNLFQTHSINDIKLRARYNARLDELDIIRLKPKEFYYANKNICGGSNLITFDAGGCECCKEQPVDYFDPNVK